MAIDTKSLTQLITEFRALQTKDAVSPDSLGYILQRIVDLLATAGTSETVDKLNELLNGFKAAGAALTSIAQGQTDRNHVYANIGKVNLSTGATSSEAGIFIQQATTERAGAMRAQQVTDLNAARKGVTDLQKQVSEINTLLDEIQEAIAGGSITMSGNKATISVVVEDGVLRVRGYSALASKGYVPYLFRNTRKRNQYHHRKRDANDKNIKYCTVRKGWNVWGSRLSVKVSGGEASFSINPKSHLMQGALGWSTSPTTLVHEFTGKDKLHYVGWGRSVICLQDKKSDNNYRMIRLRFALAFGPAIEPSKTRITPDMMVSNLAEFSLIFNSYTKTWSFGR